MDHVTRLLLCGLLFVACTRPKHPPPTLVALPPSGHGLAVEEKDDLETRRYWERFEMDPRELSAWESTLFCRLGPPLGTPQRATSGAPPWADLSAVSLHRGCHGNLKTTDGHLSDEASVVVDVGSPASVTVYVEVNE